MKISRWISLRMRNILDKRCREKQNTNFVFNFFRKSYHLWDNVDATDVNIVRHIGIAFWITKALDPLRIFNIYCFSSEKCFRECASLLRSYVLLISSRAISENYTRHLSIIIIIIVPHHSSGEHRALTKFRHLTRFLASTLTSFHVLPWSLISSKIVLHHVVRGLPRDLVPWGFHSKAAFALSPGGRRSVWPSHPTSSAEFQVRLSLVYKYL
jgi:hypothetical protein